jgi:hypothetical protein
MAVGLLPKASQQQRRSLEIGLLVLPQFLRLSDATTVGQFLDDVFFVL